MPFGQTCLGADQKARGLEVTRDQVACVASVSVGFGSKERPRNGVFGENGARAKKERWG